MMQANSLRLRITILLIAAILLILGTATLVIDKRIDKEVAQRADANLLERAQALADIFSTANKVPALNFPSYRIPPFLADDGTVYFRIRCNGQHVVSSDEAFTLAWPELPHSSRAIYADISDRHGTTLRAVAFRFSPESDLTRGLVPSDGNTDAVNAADGASDCDLGLAVDRTEVVSFQQSMDQIEIGCVLLGFLMVAVLTPLLVNRGLRPLSSLAEAMKEIGPDAPQKRLGDVHARELSPLIARFNEVLSRMEDGLARERQFASGVAHELRTPLAELRTTIEVELRYPSGRDLRALLAEIGDIGQEMERMVVALLLLTRIEAGIEKLDLQNVDVAALTQKVIDRQLRSAEQRQISLQIDIEPGVTWQADAALMDVVFSNLLGNAVAYAPIGSEVTLRCEQHGWYVRNLAPDLTEQDVVRMGQRFWRKGKDAGVHTGLGLSLAAAAARAQSVRLGLSLHDGYFQASVTC